MCDATRVLRGSRAHTGSTRVLRGCSGPQHLRVQEAVLFVCVASEQVHFNTALYKSIRKRCGPIMWGGFARVHAGPRRSEREGL